MGQVDLGTTEKRLAPLSLSPSLDQTLPHTYSAIGRTRLKMTSCLRKLRPLPQNGKSKEEKSRRCSRYWSTYWRSESTTSYLTLTDNLCSRDPCFPQGILGEIEDCRRSDRRATESEVVLVTYLQTQPL